jgi:hypothetical protein
VNASTDTPQSTADIEELLDVSHRRARAVLLEACRIGLLEEAHPTDHYGATSRGRDFLNAIRAERWTQVSTILREGSPHYKAFLDALAEIGPTDLDGLLDHLEDRSEATPYDYNPTVVEVVSDWGERFGSVQRNAFTGSYYCVECDSVPVDFRDILLDVYASLEETAGINLRQRYLSIPRLREAACERIGCSRAVFDAALLRLAGQNVGKVELSGAPLDTAAKDAALGIKQIAFTDGEDDDLLVSTSQSTDQVMQGVEQFGKQYYYFAVYDRDLTYTPEETA